jgi:putative oxidoreductase
MWVNMSAIKKIITFDFKGLPSTEWLGPLLMRLFFGYFWIINGWGKVHNLPGFAERFSGWGIPFPQLSAALSAYTELIGGSLLFVGLLSRLATLPLMFNMLVAIAAVTIKQTQGLNDFVLADEPLYILILFWLMMAGPGTASIDYLIAGPFRVNLGPTEDPVAVKRVVELPIDPRKTAPDSLLPRASAEPESATPEHRALHTL